MNPKRSIPVTVVGAVVDELDHPTDDWRDQALCLGLPAGLFYRPKGSAAPPKVCDGCPSAIPCLVHALEHHDAHGIWGGHTYQRRLKISRAVRAQRPELLPITPPARTA